MILSKNISCNLFEIRKPVWGGRKVGLASYKIAAHNRIDILYTDKEGRRIYPLPLYISGADARKYPMQAVRSNHNVKLYIIPINDLEVLERE